MPQIPADGLAITEEGEALISAFLRKLGVEYADWHDAPWVEADVEEALRRLGYALELFRVEGGGLALGASPFTLVVITDDYSVLLIRDGELYYMAASGSLGSVFEVKFLRFRSGSRLLEVKAPDVLAVLSRLFRLG
jgi:hypothetical protein